MSTNSDFVRDLYAAFGRGDMPAVLGALDPQVSWTEAEGFPTGGTYTGPDAVLNNVFASLGAEWEGFAAVPHDFVSQDDRVVALGTYSGRYRATGKSFSAPFAHVWTVRDGRIVRFQQYTDTAVVQSALT